jgi:predicted Ser/Thr protein kinase
MPVEGSPIAANPVVALVEKNLTRVLQLTMDIRSRFVRTAACAGAQSPMTKHTMGRMSTPWRFKGVEVENKVVGVAGFEPAAPASQTRCSDLAELNTGWLVLAPGDLSPPGVSFLKGVFFVVEMEIIGFEKMTHGVRL